jgi:hypothetical protein
VPHLALQCPLYVLSTVSGTGITPLFTQMQTHPLKLFTFDQFSAWLSPTISANLTSLASLGGSHGKLRPVDAEAA